MTEDTNAPETAPETSGPDVPPDHLAINPRSPFFDQEKLQRGIGIRFKGTVRTNVEEYSISEGWIRVQAGKSMDRHGNALTIKLSGPVEAWYEDIGDDAPVAKKD
ncbi:DUF3297 family protein [Novosphingobium sp. AP12]|jgi:hypothetical protein|uniref:DUF3297 family protein n=1 Tax=Novosphingobium sp. AP12 TaxID=1144305 RepID=UPI000271F650|nr:DUF3297 family protein [Novosphingobium sp. AP12]EJL26323.1 Protein of unknown function (DUF3297) [Novosphingobium sp. AP12]